MAASAIVILVPEAEPSVGLLRREHTTDGAAGMPAHVTLLYPFADDALLTTPLANRARRVLERFSVFDFRLTAVRQFANVTETHTWLEPDPALPFLEMVDALVEEFPRYPPYGGMFDKVVPHLTVASSSLPATLSRVERELEGVLPLAARARAAFLMTQVHGRWRAHDEIRLAE